MAVVEGLVFDKDILFPKYYGIVKTKNGKHYRNYNRPIKGGLRLWEAEHEVQKEFFGIIAGQDWFAVR